MNGKTNYKQLTSILDERCTKSYENYTIQVLQEMFPFVPQTIIEQGHYIHGVLKAETSKNFKGVAEETLISFVSVLWAE